MLLRGKEARDQINILGDDGVPVSYHIIFNKAEIIDFVILQQDAFDHIDASSPMERQKYMVNKVLDICNADFNFEGFQEIGAYFKRVINLLKQMNYQQFQNEQFKKIEAELELFIAEKRVSDLQPLAAV